MALRKPPLREAHADRGAKFTEFGGWDMPVEFDSIQTEHAAVRGAAGIFDVSHMGEITVAGPDAVALTDRLTTNDVAGLDVGKAQYSTITNEAGDIIDDTVVYNLPDGSDAELLFVPNAGGDEAMHERWTSYRDEWGLEAVVDNRTDAYAMFALQGPEAVDLGNELAGTDLTALGFFEATETTLAGVEMLISRSGYTGEDGLELILPTDGAATVWEAFVDERDVQPCGLGARDTLRIEAGFHLSGQDFDPDSNPRNPYEAGLEWVVDLDTDFVGRDALAEVKASGIDEEFIGFRLTERGVPRHGYDIVNTENRVVGEVTSGTMSPTLDQPVGMGYVPVEYADPGTTLRVVVRGKQKKARVQQLPFYERQ